jgi:hypothetical protein
MKKIAGLIYPQTRYGTAQIGVAQANGPFAKRLEYLHMCIGVVGRALLNVEQAKKIVDARRSPSPLLTAPSLYSGGTSSRAFSGDSWMVAFSRG